MSKYLQIKRIGLIREGNLKNYHPHAKLTGSESAKDLFLDYYNEQKFAQEVFVIATLDTKNQVTGIVEITRGTLDASLVHPREVFAPAFISASSGIVLSHNHPSGDPTPSREDFAVTRRLMECGELLGIEVLDHIVVGDGTGRAVSIREEM